MEQKEPRTHRLPARGGAPDETRTKPGYLYSGAAPPPASQRRLLETIHTPVLSRSSPTSQGQAGHRRQGGAARSPSEGQENWKWRLFLKEHVLVQIDLFCVHLQRLLGSPTQLEWGRMPMVMEKIIYS
ncbi:hypothetical protein ZWY2020_014730 [Hordeum vulgare]|nr:hypothetical protein ZWY2020_014730 [Hordeum vulgare]